MGELVVGDGEGLPGPGIEQLAPHLLAHLDEPGLAQRAVDVDRPVDGQMPYSDTTMTCAPERSASSISSPQIASMSARSLAIAGWSGPSRCRL
jgi:hypothetical protein